MRASIEGVWAYGRMKFGYIQVGIITERNFLVQWRRQDLARGGAQNYIEITCHRHNNNNMK